MWFIIFRFASGIIFTKFIVLKDRGDERDDYGDFKKT
jgi:hypothetical protein